jgi:hypothetical protein
MTTVQSEYLASINNVLSSYADKYTQRMLLGTNKQKHWETIKFIYATVLVEILTAYFSTTFANDNNFMSTMQCEILQRHFCDITNTSFFLALPNDTIPMMSPEYSGLWGDINNQYPHSC